jgi:hypothetical protein
MAALHTTIPHQDSPTLLALKGIIVGSSLFIAGGMATTNLQFLPSLVLAAKQRDANRPNSARAESGRLTPGAMSANEDKQLNLTPQAALKGTLDTQALSASSGYKVAALQFSLMSKTAFVTQVPFELLSIVASGYLAYRYRSIALPVSLWSKWAAVAGLLAAVFPLTGGFMVPVSWKIITCLLDANEY